MLHYDVAGEIFGQKIEVPVPLYAQGVLFGLFSLHPDTRYLALAKGQPDKPSSYFRCTSVHKDGSVVRYDLVPLGNEGRRRQVIPADQIERISVLHRGRINQGVIASIAGKAERTEREQTVLAFSSYLFETAIRIELYQDPTLTFSDWILHHDPSYQVKLQEILASGVLNDCIELHARHYLSRS